MSVKTREQAILAAIAPVALDDWGALESRAESLPAMLLRHGALPVKLFLDTKDASDKGLWSLVEAGVAAVLPGVSITVEGLAALPFEKYLLVNEVAVEVSALVARWVKVQAARANGGRRVGS